MKFFSAPVKKESKKTRTLSLRLEQLEVRQMLSVTLADAPETVMEAPLLSESLPESVDYSLLEAPEVTGEAEGTVGVSTPVLSGETLPDEDTTMLSSRVTVGGISFVTSDSARISWGLVKFAGSYSVYDADGNLYADDIRDPFLDLTELDAKKEYTFSVKANFTGGKQSEAGSITFCLDKMQKEKRTVAFEDSAPERLAKDTAYKDWNVGDVWKCGTGSSQEKFEVIAVFNYWETDGLYATAVRNAATKEVLLAFRGTDNIQSTIADADPKGIGYSAYYNHGTEIGAFAAKIVQAGNTLNITGHSLGGALSQWFAVDFTARKIEISKVQTFNSPGISASFIEENYNSSYCGRVEHYIQSGDIVSMAGEAFVPGWNYLYYYFDMNIIRKHSVPMTVEHLTGYTRAGLHFWVLVRDPYLSDESFTYSNSAMIPYSDIVYHSEIWLASCVMKKLDALHFRGTTEKARQELGPDIQKLLEFFKIFSQTENSSIEMTNMNRTETGISMNLQAKTGDYVVTCGCMDPDNPGNVLETNTQKISVGDSGENPLLFENLDANTDYFVAAVQYTYDEEGNISGISDFNIEYFFAEKQDIIEQDGKKIVFNPGIVAEEDVSSKFQYRLSSSTRESAWKTVSTEENEDGKVTASVKSTLFRKNESYDYRFLDENGVIYEGTFTPVQLVTPKITARRVAGSTTEMTVNVLRMDENAAEQKIRYRIFTAGSWGKWTETTFSELRDSGNAVMNEDGICTVKNLPPGATVQFKVTAEGGFSRQNGTLYLDSAAAACICTLTQPKKLSVPLARVVSDSGTSAEVTLRRVDENAENVEFQYRTLSNGKWSAWTEYASASGETFRISDLPKNSVIQVRLKAVSSDTGFKESAAIIYSRVLKRTPRLSAPIFSFNVNRDEVRTFRADEDADWYKMEVKLSTSSDWTACSKKLSEEDVRSLNLDALLGMLPQGTVLEGKYKILQIRLTAVSESSEYADSLTIRSSFVFKNQWKVIR